MKVLFVVALLLFLSACQTSRPRETGNVIRRDYLEDFLGDPGGFTVIKEDRRILDGCEFIQKFAKDTKGEGWQLIDLRPAQSPYSGTIAMTSAEDRWNMMFRALVVSSKQICGHTPAQFQFTADQLDYSKYNSADYPKRGQIRFLCL